MRAFSVLFHPLPGLLLLALATIFAPKQALACEVISVTGSNQWYPFAYRDQEGDLTGVAPTIARALFESQGLEVIFRREKPWKRNLAELEAGKLDVIAGAYWDAGRAERFIYTQPITRDEVRIFTRQGAEFPFTKLDDLKGLRGVKPLGVSLGKDFEDFAARHLDVREVPSYPGMIRQVAQGRADYMGLALYNGMRQIELAGLAGKVVPLSYPVAVNGVHLILSPNSPCADRLEGFNLAIEELRDSGEVSAIIRRFVGGMLTVN